MSYGEQMKQIEIKIMKNELYFNDYVMIKIKQREMCFIGNVKNVVIKQKKNDFDYCNARMVNLWTNEKH